MGGRDDDNSGRNTGHSCFCCRDPEDGGSGEILYYRIVKPTAPGTELEVWFWSQWNPNKCVMIFEYAHTDDALIYRFTDSYSINTPDIAKLLQCNMVCPLKGTY